MKKEISWDLEMYNIVACLIYFPIMTCSDVVNYACPTVDEISASLLLHLFLFIRLVGVLIIAFHSFNIALYKYYIIVIKKPIKKEDKFMERRYISILIILPILLGIGWYIRAAKNISSNITEEMLCATKATDLVTDFSKFVFCSVKDEENWSFIYIITASGCFLHCIFTLLFAANIFEGFIYHRIFSYAKRYNLFLN